jgi:hypothetical protein
LWFLSGSESGDWYIDLKTGKGSAGQGKPPSAADAVLTMDSKDFFDMFSGNWLLSRFLFQIQWILVASFPLPSFSRIYRLPYLVPELAPYK